MAQGNTAHEKRAKVLAKPLMMKFDRILAQAEALLVEHPVRTELTEVEIKQIADYFYAHELGADQELREEGVELASGNHSFFMSLFFCLPPWKSVMFPKYTCAIRFERATDAEPI